MKVQIVNDKRRVQSMSTSTQQNDDLINLAASIISPKKQIQLTSTRYGEEVKAILKNIQETIGDEQSEQNSLRENSIKKESNYSIKSQNLFMQGPRSMIQRELALAVKAAASSHRNSNSQEISNNQVDKNSNTCSQINLLNRSSRNQKSDATFTKQQQIFMETPRQGSGSSFIIRKNLNSSIPSLSINTSGLKRDKILQSFHFSNNNNKEQQYVTIGKSPHFSSNSNVVSGVNGNGNISSRLLEGEFGCACGATTNGSGTRFRELQRLSAENNMLNKRIAELQREVQDMDEFKIGLEHRHSEQHFNERRIDLLKATIARQQKQIRRLTSLLQTSKKLLTEILAVINFFKETSSKVHLAKQINNTKGHFKHQPTGYISSRNANSTDDNNNNGENNIQENFQEDYQEDDKNKLPSTEDGILQQLDSRLANVSLRSLLNNIGLGEARDSFVNTFTAAYDKILQYERTNQEFKHMFAISHVNNNRNTYNRNNNNNNNNISRSNVSIDLSPTVRSPLHKNNKNINSSCKKLPLNSENGQQYFDDSSVMISYKQPVTEFINKYKNYLPITTIFDSFPSQHKDTLNNMLSVLSAVVKKADQGFKQAATFQLFKSNPFLYIDQQNRLNLPETLLNYRGDFETYLRFKDKMLQIHLSQSQINQTEQLLSVLLDSLTTMYGDTLVSHKNDTSSEISVLITNLKKAIEQLIALGIIIGPDSGYNHARFLVVSTNANKEMESNMKKLSSSLVIDDNSNTNRGNDGIKQVPIVSLKNLNIDESSQKTNKNHYQQQFSTSRIGRMSNNINNPQSPVSQSVLPFDVNEPDELRVLRVERDVECTNDFFDRHSICENILDDLYRSIKSNSDQQDQLALALKLAGIISKLKLLFEMKNNMLLIKEAQIDFMRNQLYLYKQDINSCTGFVEQCQEGVTGFFNPIKSKFADLLTHFNSVMDSKTSSVVSDQKSKKNLVLHFKRTLKEILERVEQITNRPLPVNTLHILQIQQQFNEKVTILTQSQEHIKKLLAH